MSDKTICTTCLRLKQGLCDGEKELTACLSYKRMTNADRIRAMTDEELAKVLHCQRTQSPYVVGNDSCETTNCIDCTLAWLKQEVSE